VKNILATKQNKFITQTEVSMAPQSEKKGNALLKRQHLINPRQMSMTLITRQAENWTKSSLND